MKVPVLISKVLYPLCVANASHADTTRPQADMHGQICIDCHALTHMRSLTLYLLTCIY